MSQFNEYPEYESQRGLCWGSGIYVRDIQVESNVMCEQQFNVIADAPVNGLVSVIFPGWL